MFPFSAPIDSHVIVANKTEQPDSCSLNPDSWVKKAWNLRRFGKTCSSDWSFKKPFKIYLSEPRVCNFPRQIPEQKSKSKKKGNRNGIWFCKQIWECGRPPRMEQGLCNKAPNLGSPKSSNLLPPLPLVSKSTSWGSSSVVLMAASHMGVSFISCLHYLKFPYTFSVSSLFTFS